MIQGLVFAVLLGFLVIMVLVIPAGYLLEGVSEAFHSAGSYLALWNVFFPVTQLAYMMGIAVLVIGSSVVVRIVKYLVNVARGSGG